MIFPEKEQPSGDLTPQQKMNLIAVGWKEMQERHNRRSEAARSVLDCALHEPSHRLLQQTLDETCGGWQDRTSETPLLSEEECLEIAAFAAVDAYKTESGLIEAAKTIISSVDRERSLERSPIYPIANKMFEMRYPMRQQTISRLAALRDALGANKQIISKIDGLCGFVYDALYLRKGCNLPPSRLGCRCSKPARRRFRL